MTQSKTKFSLQLACGLLIALYSLRTLSQTARSDRFVVNDSIRIHYIDAGPHTDMPTLLLIPGWRFSANIWRSQIDYFSATRRVIAIDPRSQGDSTKTTEGNTPEVRAQDLEHLILALKLPRVVLAGWSQGVQDIAAYIDQFGQDKIAGLVFVDEGVSAGAEEVRLNPQLSEQILEMAGSLAANPKKFSEEFVPQMFKRPHDPAFLQQLVTDSLKTPTSTAIAMLITATFTVDQRPVLAKISVPTLMVCAGNCGHPPIAHSQLVLMDGVGHALFVDDPTKFNTILERFMKKLEP